METASFTGLIRALIIIVLIYYALRFLMRLLAPVIVQQVVKKAGENLYQQQQYNANQNSQHDEATQTKRPAEKKKVGEYIDYEEIE